MSDIDELDEIAEQQRYGFDCPSRGTSKGSRKRFKLAQQRGASEQRSVGKQSLRSSERRESLVIRENQD